MSELEAFAPPLDKRREQLRSILEPAIAQQDCELVAIAIVGATKAPTLRLYIDKEGEEAIEMKTLEVLNRTLGDLLDVEDAHLGLFGAAYDLEVSSPGVDRPLTKKSHYLKAVNEEVKVKTRVAVNGARTHRGTLTTVNEDSIVITEGESSTEIPFSSVDSANIVFVFPGQAKPRTKRKKKSKKPSKKKSA